MKNCIIRQHVFLEFQKTRFSRIFLSCCWVRCYTLGQVMYIYLRNWCVQDYMQNSNTGQLWNLCSSPGIHDLNQLFVPYGSQAIMFIMKGGNFFGPWRPYKIPTLILSVCLSIMFLQYSQTFLCLSYDLSPTS